ncbi:hypothetical protein K8R43_04260 [archaeon]|nr:hypothetical protein [archaeon]
MNAGIVKKLFIVTLVLFLASIFLIFVFSLTPATGCMPVGDAERIEPPLDCVGYRPDDCIGLEITNNCDEELRQLEDPSTGQWAVIEPRKSARLQVDFEDKRREGLERLSWTLELTYKDQEYVIYGRDQPSTYKLLEHFAWTFIAPISLVLLLLCIILGILFLYLNRKQQKS